MLFSIVIPVYNVERYLDECLQSIIGQVKDVVEGCELILIDDGSKDESGKICDQYQKKYPNLIKVLHNTNHGLLLTRRYGFKMVEGDYIINCDSDDCLEKGALKKLRDAIIRYQYPDVIFFNHYTYDGKQKIPTFKDIFTDKESCAVACGKVFREFLTRHSIVSMCGKTYKRECIDQERDYTKYARVSNGEDTLQSLEIFEKAKTFVYLNESLYDYRAGSGMTNKFDSEYYFAFKQVFEKVKEYQNSWRLPDFERLFAIKVMQTAGRAITQSRYNHWTSYREHKNYLQKIYEDEMFQENVAQIDEIKNSLQKDHYILLKLLQKKMYLAIITLLNAKNKLDR